MKLLIINLPYEKPIMRKYSCSYHAVGFLYPPLELMRIATIIKDNSPEISIEFIDAIAENLNFKSSLKKIEDYKPDAIVTMTSVDYINTEYEQIKKIKEQTKIPFIVVGYIPDLFRSEYQLFDIIIGNNFEQVFYESCKDKTENLNAFINNINTHLKTSTPFNPDIINKVDYSFINPQLYSDVFCKGKTAFTYFSFGCPFQCSFCIKTYNLQKAYFRNFTNIKEELDYFYSQGYKNIRILDDNCTLNKDLLKDIFQYLEGKDIHLNFLGLTRMDLIDDEVIDLMSKLNFKKIYIGLETISSSRQKEYNKNIVIDKKIIDDKLIKLKNKGIEAVIFIIFNPLSENFQDLKNTLKFIKQLHVYYAAQYFTTAYPGTPFFNNNIGKINFSPFPFISELRNDSKINLNKIGLYFLISFYVFNGFNIFRMIYRYIKFPKQTFIIISNILSYIFSIKRERKDFI